MRGACQVAWPPARRVGNNGSICVQIPVIKCVLLLCHHSPTQPPAGLTAKSLRRTITPLSSSHTGTPAAETEHLDASVPRARSDPQPPGAQYRGTPTRAAKQHPRTRLCACATPPRTAGAAGSQTGGPPGRGLRAAFRGTVGPPGAPPASAARRWATPAPASLPPARHRAGVVVVLQHLAAFLVFALTWSASCPHAGLRWVRRGQVGGRRDTFAKVCRISIGARSGSADTRRGGALSTLSRMRSLWMCFCHVLRSSADVQATSTGTNQAPVQRE